ncbi:hypothetical protein [Nostoc punctiforme]|uniref:Uncharacterized protein n=2 Tax=Nostoc punctiforme TaxID=272131 RepID=B2ITE5_NOSP7|nr:hypothetical protein [Nostoc punctiforme]ACC81176.1 hypothetical protein Npun_R2622 [Nostoc punctiforme PCC 73102]RCJ41121.1 hypothetical protein A6769_38875 [Nostoc punctiforme NIES-2108]
MPLQKERTRIIYETCLGKSVRAYQWQELKNQLVNARLPLTIDNLRFVAKCKRVAPRKAIASHVLNLVVESATDLNGSVKGAVIKDYIYKKCPSLSKHKFYRAFRSMDISYRNDGTYSIAELGEVLYKLFA